jgi:hypothetical protein
VDCANCGATDHRAVNCPSLVCGQQGCGKRFSSAKERQQHYHTDHRRPQQGTAGSSNKPIKSALKSTTTPKVQFTTTNRVKRAIHRITDATVEGSAEEADSESREEDDTDQWETDDQATSYQDEEVEDNSNKCEEDSSTSSLSQAPITTAINLSKRSIRTVETTSAQPAAKPKLQSRHISRINRTMACNSEDPTANDQSNSFPIQFETEQQDGLPTAVHTIQEPIEPISYTPALAGLATSAAQFVHDSINPLNPLSSMESTLTSDEQERARYERVIIDAHVVIQTIIASPVHAHPTDLQITLGNIRYAYQQLDLLNSR